MKNVIKEICTPCRFLQRTYILCLSTLNSFYITMLTTQMFGLENMKTGMSVV